MHVRPMGDNNSTPISGARNLERRGMEGLAMAVKAEKEGCLHVDVRRKGRTFETEALSSAQFGIGKGWYSKLLAESLPDGIQVVLN